MTPSATTRAWSEVDADLFRICVADVNCYLWRTPDGLTLFDAGLPGMRRPLDDLLAHLGATTSDIDALVLTHGHFDHVGMARRVRGAGASVLVHAGDATLARHPYRYRPASPRLPYVLGHPRGIPVITRMAADGALTVKGVEASARVSHGRPVDAPGSPLALWTPGHTDGHCAYLLEDRGVLISGDALVTLDPYTGRSGAQIVARAATADSDEAMHSLDVLAQTDANLVLSGHGEPSREGIRADVAEARRIGPH
ncbi:MBL fold metallo-hydrolase [Microbacterium sp. H83]|uniref:MBL fold metallo-hydrolase n=1 Tax=Microbacterium sp. H83 TaxID=1827324 RepID=UPI0007F34941|nr:MBL fold metallo-hydrolase [Microbacterium sp. H83]OAN39187.1 Zn-dependent hydrolase [Microbacterium sp. H83]